MSDQVTGAEAGPPPGRLGWALGMVLRRWQEMVDDALVDLPQGARGYHILTAVVHDDLPTQAALAARVSIDRTIMTYMIDELEEAGLIERRPARHDRRVRKVVATPLGIKVHALAEAHVKETEEHLLSMLAPAQRDQLRGALWETAAAIRDHNPHLNPCDAVARVLRSNDIRAAMTQR